MGKNVRLANIYIKIYNKRPLTMEDLAFLAKYDPECFEKTCHNLVYNVPETKELMKQRTAETQADTSEQNGALKSDEKQERPMFEAETMEKEAESTDRIEALLENLKDMEGGQFDLQKLNADSVKHLLGNLYMELLFPHNDKERTFEMGSGEEYSTFNKKA